MYVMVFMSMTVLCLQLRVPKFSGALDDPAKLTLDVVSNTERAFPLIKNLHFVFKPSAYTMRVFLVFQEPKLQTLLPKLLACEGRLTAAQVLADDYFLSGQA